MCRPWRTDTRARPYETNFCNQLLRAKALNQGAQLRRSVAGSVVGEPHPAQRLVALEATDCQQQLEIGALPFGDEGVRPELFHLVVADALQRLDAVPAPDR